MKSLTLTTTLLLTLLVLGGCNNEVTYDQLELVERSGLMHEISPQNQLPEFDAPHHN